MLILNKNPAGDFGLEPRIPRPHKILLRSLSHSIQWQARDHTPLIESLFCLNGRKIDIYPVKFQYFMILSYILLFFILIALSISLVISFKKTQTYDTFLKTINKKYSIWEAASGIMVLYSSNEIISTLSLLWFSIQCVNTSNIKFHETNYITFDLMQSYYTKNILSLKYVRLRLSKNVID
jgi:hypothetical protein